MEFLHIQGSHLLSQLRSTAQNESTSTATTGVGRLVDWGFDLLRRMRGIASACKVSKLSQLSKLARENNTASKTVEADRLHTMFLAMADARSVLVKLADRLHNMMTLEALSMVKQQRFAKETLEIFAPLANRLGIYSWKEKLENLCFKYLYPQQHKLLSSNLERRFDEAMIALAIQKLDQALKAGGISYHALYGRHKSLYSIHSKMGKKTSIERRKIHQLWQFRLLLSILCQDLRVTAIFW